MKKCTKCKELRSKKSFYHDPRVKDGLYSACKKCCLNHERLRYLRKGKKTQKQPYNAEWQRKNRKKHAHKISARQKLRYNIKKGAVIKPVQCEYPQCTIFPEAHHWDYNEPLSVTWLCRRHHRLADSVMRLLASNQTL